VLIVVFCLAVACLTSAVVVLVLGAGRR